MPRRHSRPGKLWPADQEKLLAAMGEFRSHISRTMANVSPTAADYKALENLMDAIDDTTEALTGDRERFWEKGSRIVVEHGKGE